MSYKKKSKHKGRKSSAKKNKARYMCAFEHSYPTHIPRHSRGNCGLVAELISRDMISKGLTYYKVVEGEVKFSNGRSHRHTWMEYGNAKYDPCLEQFKYYGDDYDLMTVKYIVGSKSSPGFFLKVCEARPLPNWYVEDVINNRLKSSRFISVA